MIRRLLHIAAAVALVLAGIYIPPPAATDAPGSAMGAHEVTLGYTHDHQVRRAPASTVSAGDGRAPCVATIQPAPLARTPRTLPDTPAHRAVPPRPSDPQAPGTGAAVR